MVTEIRSNSLMEVKHTLPDQVTQSNCRTKSGLTTYFFEKTRRGNTKNSGAIAEDVENGSTRGVTQSVTILITFIVPKRTYQADRSNDPKPAYNQWWQDKTNTTGYIFI